MKTVFIPVSGAPSQGIPSLKSVPGGAAYSDCVRVDLADHTQLFVSGKMGTRNGELAGGTLAEQARQAFVNIQTTIESQGGSLADVTRLRIYVKNIDPQSIRDVHAVRREFFEAGRFPASSLLQIVGFVREDGLIEIEADVVMAKKT